MRFIDLAIITVGINDYKSYFYGITKSAVVSKVKDADLIEKEDNCKYEK